MTSPIGVGRQSPVQNPHLSDEIQPAGISPHNQALQVSRSSSPPISPLQISTPVEAQGNKPSASLSKLLQGDLQKLNSIDREQNALEHAKHYMMMDGRLLGSDEAKHFGFEGAQAYLSSIGRTLHPYIDGHEEQEAQKADFNALISAGNFTTEALNSFLKKDTDRTVDQLVAYHLLHKEVLGSDNLQPHEKSLVENSHKAFRDYAARAIEQRAEQLPMRMDAFISSRLGMAENMAKREGLSPEQQELADRTVAELQKAKQSFTETNEKGENKSTNTLKAALKPATDNINAEEFIASLKADQASMKNQAQVAAVGGFPQGGASFFHFGLGRNLVNTAMDGNVHVGAQGLIAGLNLGILHKFVSDVPRSLMQKGIDTAFPYATVAKVSPAEVLPDAPRVISVGGHKKVLDAAEHRNAQDKVEKERAGFLREQRNHYFGTVTGDHEYYQPFGMMNLLDTALNEFTRLDTTGLAGATIAGAVKSGFAGMIAGALQPLGKFNSTYGDNKIPTHKLTNADPKVLEKGLANLKFWQGGDAAADGVGKIAGAIQGEYVSTVALGQLRNLITGDGLPQSIGRMFVDYISSPAILTSFLPQVGATAKAAGAASGLPEGVDRHKLAWKNITDPNEQSRNDRKKLKGDAADLGLAGNAADVATSVHTVATGVLRAIPQSLVAIEQQLEASSKARAERKKTENTPEDQRGTELHNRGGSAV